MADKQTKSKRSGIIWLIILAAIVGVIAGIAGHLITRAYILGNDYDIPFFGDINLTKDRNFIISGAKKVVVEQNDKILETISAVSPSLVGIFNKKETKAVRPGQFNPDNYYRLDQEAGQGLIITSDGWIMTSFFIEEARPPVVLSDYVVIGKNGKIYAIDGFIKDPITSFSFIHVGGVNDFPIRNFAAGDEIESGEFVMVLNWDNKDLLTYIAGRKNIGPGLDKSSDLFSEELVLSDGLNQDFWMSAIFDLGGNIVGLIDKAGEIRPITHFSSVIESLFRFREIRRPALGVNYIDLSFLAGENDLYKKGAVIYKSVDGPGVAKDSPAQKAGLKEGDIITSVDGAEVDENNSLTHIIQSYLPGDKVNIAYLRNGEKQEQEVELGRAE